MRNHTLGHLLRGSTIIFSSLFSASELIDWVLTESASFAFMVEASVKGILAEAPDSGGPLFPDLQVFIAVALACGSTRFGGPGEPRFPALLLLFLSGTCSSNGADFIERADTDGRIVPHARVEIVDEDDCCCQRTPACCRSNPRRRPASPNRSRPEGDRIKNGWAYTGDLGKISSAF